MHSSIVYIFVFFFQAEDGIRDADVTGVQTCALPICSVGRYWKAIPPDRDAVHQPLSCDASTPRARAAQQAASGSDARHRSEERRVGKEWRSWRSRDH